MGKNNRTHVNRKLRRFLKARPGLCRSEAPVITVGNRSKGLKRKAEHQIKMDIGNLRIHLDNLRKAREKELIARKVRKAACKNNNADNKDSNNKEVADIGSDNGEVVDTANHENETSTNDSDDDGNESDDEYSRSDDELVGEHEKNVGDNRSIEGGYDSVDDLLDSVEESDSHFTPGSSPRWNHDPFGLNRSKSSSRSSSWSNIMIEESPVNSKPSTPPNTPTYKRGAKRTYPASGESPQPIRALLPKDTGNLD